MRADKRPRPTPPRGAGHAAALAAAFAVAACGPKADRPGHLPKPTSADPWKEKIAAQAAPYLSNEVVTGMVIGVIDGDRQWTYGFGSAGNGAAAPTATTLFELGAVTKAYTGVLLADAIERKEVEVSTPVASLLPLGVTVPTRDQIEITLEDLITHRSGLPEMPPGMATIPAARFGEDALFADLAATQLRFAPRQGFLYSNFGLGVLGAALAHKAGAASWSDALATRVLGPLHLTDTVIAVPAGQSARHAVGHADDGRVVPYSSFGALAPAGGLRSTAADQLVFLRANIEAAAGKAGPLYAAMRRSHDILVGGKHEQIAMGWFVDAAGRRYASGATDGFHAFIEVDLAARHAVVVLAATGTSLIDQLGDAVMDMLDRERPTRIKFPKPEQMMPLIGAYKVVDHDAIITVELDGKKLIVRTADGARSRLMPVGGTRFFLERDQAFVAFDPAGSRLVIEAPGQKLVAERTTPAPTPAPAPTPTPTP